MNTPLRILFVEDSADDAQLAILQLEMEGINTLYQRVDTEGEYIAALESTPDLILSDYAMPKFNGLRALKLLKESGRDIPFILISGTVGEDIAVNAIKQGADDYLMKDRLGRLGSAIRHALEQKQLRMEKARADESVLQSQRAYQDLVNTVDGIVWEADANTVEFSFVSKQAERLLGYPIERWINEPTFWTDHIHPDDRNRVVEYCATCTREKLSHEFEYRMIAANGTNVWLRDIVSVIVENDLPVKLRGIMVDITESKLMEDALRTSEDYLRLIVNTEPECVKLIAPDGNLLEMNPAGLAMIEVDSLAEVIGKPVVGIVEPKHRDAFIDLHKRVMSGESGILEFEIIGRKGTHRWLETHAVPLRNSLNQIEALLGVTRDITERKRAEEAERQRAKEADTLREAVSVTTSSLRQEETIERILEQLGQVVPYDSASVQILHEGYLEIVGGRGWDKSENIIGVRFPVPGDNPNTVVIQTKKPHILKETTEKSSHFRNITHQLIRSWMGIPLILGERITGMLAVGSGEPDHFTGDHARLASAFAAHVTISLENARLFEETRQQLENLQALNRVSTALRTAQTREEMYAILLDESLAIFHANDGCIQIYESAQGYLQQVVGRGWLTLLKDSKLRRGYGIAGNVFASGQPHIASDVLNEPLLIESVRHLVPSGWCQMTVPIRTTDEIIGVMNIAVKHPRQILPSEVELLTTIAEMAGNAIHRSSLNELTENRLRNLESLHEIERVISSNLDIRITLNMLVDRAMARLGAQAVAVLLFDPQTYALNYAGGRGFRTRGIEHSIQRLGEGNAGIAAQERRIVAIQDINREGNGQPPNQWIDGEGFVSYYCAPLIAKGKVKGVLETYHRTPFTADSEWIDFLETLATQAAVAIDNAELFDGLQRSNLNLALAYDATIEGWSRALDLRDKETEGHTQRVTTMTLKLAQAINVDLRQIIHIRRGALLHDIGKMGVPDSILLKKGGLTDEEWEVMHRHPIYAYELLLPIEYLKPALDIPYCHHEKWDGTGYPRGLKGEEIPLVARIFSVADVWDALTTDRVYRKKWSREKALEHIKSESGKHFDPNVITYFLELIDEQDGDTEQSAQSIL